MACLNMKREKYMEMFYYVSAPTKPGETFFDVLEKERLINDTRLPASNAFEEMSQWTKQGKMWKFPIDNEQGEVENKLPTII